MSSLSLKLSLLFVGIALLCVGIIALWVNNSVQREFIVYCEQGCLVPTAQASSPGMPGGVSGLELCSRLMKARAGLKAIVASGYGTEAADDGDAVTPDVAFLSKPFDVKKLAAAVRERLDRKP